MDYNKIYNTEHYWTTLGELPYTNEAWFHLFEKIADNIVEDIKPKTVIDVGCAMGYLVAALRDRGVEAYGIDISDYAISKVREDIKPYCRVMSAMEKFPCEFPQRYDLLITIEVAEHLYEEDGVKFIENICKYSDDIIFSSSPDDIEDVTHVNVQQPEYWAKRFANNGFYKMLEYNVSYIAPQTVRFIKKDITIIRLIEDYERNLRNKKNKQENLEKKINELNTKFLEHNSAVDLVKEYEKDLCDAKIKQEGLVQQYESILQNMKTEQEESENKNTELTKKILEKENILNETQTKMQLEFDKVQRALNVSENTVKNLTTELEKTNDILNQQIAEKTDYSNELFSKLSDANFQLQLIYNSHGYRLLQKYYKIKFLIIPKGSKRFIIAKLLFKGPKYIKSGYIKKAFIHFKKVGFKGFWSKIVNIVNNNNFKGELVNDPYKLWIKINEPDELELIKQKGTKFNWNPLISIVVPLYNTPMLFLKEMIESVIKQTYSNWELCLADGGSKNIGEIEEAINKFKDNRIKLKIIGENKGIAENTNQAISIAIGEFIAFLDHDDIIPPFSLFEVVKSINNNLNVEFIYSDDDRFMHSINNRSNPCFKPDFSPDNLRCCNYIGHFSIVKRSLLDRIGLLNSQFDGSQDYDLVLRATEITKNIIHIPKILYHWRMHENSVCMNTDAKEYAYDAAKDAITTHLGRLKLEGEVENGIIKGSYKIKYKIKGNPLISIVIPTKDHIGELKACVNSILEKSTYTNYEIILVENNSNKEETFNYYKSCELYEKIKIVYWKGIGFNYSSIVNYGIENAAGEFMIILNNDTEIIAPQWIEELLMYAQRGDVGSVGGKLYYPDNTIWNTGIALDKKRSVTLLHNKVDKNSPGYYGRTMVVQNFSALAGACIMVKKDLFISLGGLDASNFKVAHNDMDFSLKIIQSGRINVFTPYCEVIHHESKSRGSDFTEENLIRFMEEDNKFIDKWKDYLEYGDPYYNINLSVDSPLFQIKTEKVKYKI